MSYTQIEHILLDLDRLQGDALLQIEALLPDNGPEPALGVSKAVLKEQKAKSIHDTIEQICELMAVAAVYTRQLLADTAQAHYLAETLEVWGVRVQQLRDQFRAKQLAVYAMENEAIHKQRLAEYGAVVEKSGDGDEALEQPVKKESSPVKTEDKILQQNKNITAKLQQSKQLMEMTVMQTELNIDSLDQQSQDMSRLNSKVMDMGTLLARLRQIVRFIEQQDKGAKRRIYMSICFLVACAAWVLWRRVLRLPVRLVFWAVLKSMGVLGWAAALSKRAYTPEAGQLSLLVNVGSILATGSTLATSSIIATLALLTQTTRSSLQASSLVQSVETPLAQSLESLSGDETWTQSIREDSKPLTWVSDSDTTVESTVSKQTKSESIELKRRDPVSSSAIPLPKSQSSLHPTEVVLSLKGAASTLSVSHSKEASLHLQVSHSVSHSVSPSVKADLSSVSHPIQASHSSQEGSGLAVPPAQLSKAHPKELSTPASAKPSSSLKLSSSAQVLSTETPHLASQASNHSAKPLSTAGSESSLVSLVHQTDKPERDNHETEQAERKKTETNKANAATQGSTQTPKSVPPASSSQLASRAPQPSQGPSSPPAQSSLSSVPPLAQSAVLSQAAGLSEGPVHSQAPSLVPSPLVKPPVPNAQPEASPVAGSAHNLAVSKVPDARPESSPIPASSSTPIPKQPSSEAPKASLNNPAALSGTTQSIQPTEVEAVHDEL